MRLQPSCMIKFCIAKAAECRRRADAATDDPSQRQTWLAMEGEWFYLARSYDNERRGNDAQSLRRKRSMLRRMPLWSR
jgi:hypothetical protein